MPSLEWIFLAFLNALKLSWQSFIDLLPYVIAGVLVSEILKLTSWTKLIYKWTSKSPVIAVIAATVLGILSPLCTWGTVPIVIQMYKAKVHIAPLVVYLSCSSLMNPQLFVITWGGLGELGPEMALVRLLCVTIFGLLLGAILYQVPPRLIVRPNFPQDDEEIDAIKNRAKKTFEIKKFALSCLDNFRFIIVYVVIGVLIGEVVNAYIPTTWLYYLFQPGKITSVFFAALLGVPVYACGGGAIAMVASFLRSGMSKGSAMAFLVVGPATRIAPLMAIASLLRPLFIVAYCALVIAFSLVVGMIYI